MHFLGHAMLALNLLRFLSLALFFRLLAIFFFFVFAAALENFKLHILAHLF